MKFRALCLRGLWITILTFAIAGAWLQPAVTSAQRLPPETYGTVTALDIPGTTFVAGAGTGTLDERFPEEYRGDNVLVGLIARVQPDQSGRGTFVVSHRQPTGELRAELRGDIKCLRVEGDYAVVTGVATYADTPGLPDDELHEGTVVAIVVQDSGVGGDTMIWRFGPEGSSTDCTEIPAQTAVSVEHGDFVVLD